MLKENILKLVKEGKSYNEISKILNCAKSTISFHCKNNDLFKGDGKIDDELINDIKNFYRVNSRDKTAKKFNICGNTVIKYCGKKSDLILSDSEKDIFHKNKYSDRISKTKINLEYPFNNNYETGYLNINKEPRRLILLIDKNKNKTSISYARYLMSVKLGRFLDTNEHVDHIDNNKLNDVIDNLQILSPKENNIKKVKHLKLKK